MCGHGGNIHALKRNNHTDGEIIDFSANINPAGPPTWLRGEISRTLTSTKHYPEPDSFELKEKIASERGLQTDQIVVANGTTEILHVLPRALPCNRAIIPVPSYIDYKNVMELNSIEVFPIVLKKDCNFHINFEELSSALEKDDLVLIGSPNNPSGNIAHGHDLFNCIANHPEVLFVIDEAFLEFVDSVDSYSGLRKNIITLNSLTKFFAIPGLRLGYAVMDPKFAKACNTFIPPWTVNTFAQEVGKRLLADTEYINQSLQYLKALNNTLQTHLKQFPQLRIYPSQTNFFLIEILSEISAEKLQEFLMKRGIAVRTCSNYEGLDDSFFRIAVRTDKENFMLVEALRTFFSSQPPSEPLRVSKKPAIMFQGTSSNAGKSVLVTALCRILIQDGVRVAPFKAQNMSLNSFVTHDGLEMGRAQVVQAQAAKLDPDVRMNPVLLKPNSDVGSQVIVNGLPVGNMSVSQYVKYKEKARIKAHMSYDSLASEFDALVLEGAGSPGEVNLKHHDIVNMDMARYAESPVILVGDIDRGGVYASFIGTLEVLNDWERELVKGYLVNRFRGDSTLLESAHNYVFERSDIPVIGTVPYLHNIGIPEEDSVSFKEGKLQKERPSSDHVEIALINLPHISNFTDIEPFLEEPDVYLHIVDSPEKLRTADAIIIPGSKNVMGDLAFLDTSGLGKEICSKALSGCVIVGICGGYQILGRNVADPHSIESDSEIKEGLNLLSISTTLEKEKTLTRQSGIHLESGLKIFGYEIHHGISATESRPLLQFDQARVCGSVHQEFPIWGAYLHGIFDADEFRRWFIDDLRKRRGLSAVNKVVASYDLEQCFDKLADTVRNSIDMDVIYQLLGL